MTAQETELFDTAPYDVPFQKADGQTVTDLNVSFGGQIWKNRHDPDQAAEVERLTLGSRGRAIIDYVVVAKAQGFSEDSEGRLRIPHTVKVRIEAFTPQ